MAKLQNVTTVNMIDGEITAIKYDGAVYSKVEGNGKFGDVLLRVKHGIPGQVSLGCYFEGHDNRYSDDQTVYYRDEEGDVMGSSLDRFVVFRKASASAPFAEMVVSRVEAVEKRMDALEGAKDTETLVKGDRVLISGRSIYKALDFDGKFGKLVKVDYDGEHLVSFGGEHQYYFHRGQLTKVAGTEAPAQPKTGDIVVITANTNGSSNHVGDIGKVGGCRTSDARVEVIGGRTVGNWTYYGEMRLATPAEIAKYETDAQQAELAAQQAAKDSVFIKAGRKPNEYRKGDVVRITDGRSHSLSVGDVGLISVAEYGLYRVSISGKRDAGNYAASNQIEIVCFAENRADLAKGAIE